MKRRIPTPKTGNRAGALTPGQVMDLWQTTPSWLGEQMDSGRLVRDERGLISNKALAGFVSEHADLYESRPVIPR